MSTSRRSPLGVASGAPHNRSIVLRTRSWSCSVLIGLTCILHRFYINLAVFSVSPQPLDKNYAPSVVNGSDQPIVVTFDIKDHPFDTNNACRGIHLGDFG